MKTSLEADARRVSAVSALQSGKILRLSLSDLSDNGATGLHRTPVSLAYASVNGAATRPSSAPPARPLPKHADGTSSMQGGCKIGGGLENASVGSGGIEEAAVHARAQRQLHEMHKRLAASQLRCRAQAAELEQLRASNTSSALD